MNSIVMIRSDFSFQNCLSLLCRERQKTKIIITVGSTIIFISSVRTSLEHALRISKYPLSPLTKIFCHDFSFFRLFQTHPDIGRLFPDVKNQRDLEVMRCKNRLSGHPLRMISVLSEAVSSINDAKIFYRKMDNIGRLMAKAGIDDQNLQVLGWLEYSNKKSICQMKISYRKIC